MKSLPVFKRLSTWVNIISFIAAALMANPEALGFPVAYSSYVWMASCVAVAGAQVYKQNSNAKEWF
ncbi:TMhelix containing protein [Vibrio phage 1.151.O._10N.222.46.B1]|nr:TMhelix containing protein [Vibrio phage 1.151.O._10N.222.46.B1]